MLGPIIEQVSESNPDISFYKVNVDEESELAHKFRVSSIPTVVIFKDEKIVDKFVGYLPVEQIQSFINKNK
jgi:thioredoxin 1